MAKHTPAAGGFFLILAVIAGFLWGVMSGTPLFGALAGTGLGIIIAVAVWLFDRRRAD